MTGGFRRVDGWKAIAAHFGRDRSTVVRWANTSDLPVRRVPGRKGNSVWAYAHELDAWLTKGEPVAPGEAARADGGRPQTRRLLWVSATVVLTLLLAAGGAAVWSTRAASGPTARSQRLPGDPAVTALYLQARDDWSTRTRAGLERAMSGFSEVIRRDPGFAPAYAGVADTYILSREYADMPDAIAYPKAEAAAGWR
jgi:hypothetical protein